MNKASEMLLLLSAFAGAVHVLSPDHWMPASILAWQRGWRLSKVSSFAAGVFAIHVILGFLVFFGLNQVFNIWLAHSALPFWSVGSTDSTHFLLLTFALIASLAIFRGSRISRIREVFAGGGKSVWAMLAVFSLLGPAEAIVPVFFKAKMGGVGYLLPFIAFLSGTVVMGTLFIGIARLRWNTPQSLPRALEFMQSRSVLLPFAAASAASIVLLVRFL